MIKIQFSVLSYYPSIIANENINVGVAIYNLDTNYRYFYMMKNWNRLKAFDDELDLKFTKATLDGIKGEIESLKRNDEKFILSEYTRHFVNELKFSQVLEKKVDNEEEAENFINTTIKIHMRLDLDKKERLKIDDEITYVKNQLKENNIKYSVKPLIGFYDEPIQYDYVVDGYAFKTFIFEGKEIKRMISNAKTWSFNAHKNKDEFKTIFVYDKMNDGSEDFNIVNKILAEYADGIMTTIGVLEFTAKIEKENDIQLSLSN